MKKVILKIDASKIAALPTVDLLLLRETQGKDEHYLERESALAVRAELARRGAAVRDTLGGVAVEIESRSTGYPYDDEHEVA